MEERAPVNYREKYGEMKGQFKFLIYENESLKDELLKYQHRLVKVSRDQKFLMDRLMQYEVPADHSSSSSDDSDSGEETESSEDEKPPEMPSVPQKRKKIGPSEEKRARVMLPNVPAIVPPAVAILAQSVATAVATSTPVKAKAKSKSKQKTPASPKNVAGTSGSSSQRRPQQPAPPKEPTSKPKQQQKTNKKSSQKPKPKRNSSPITQHHHRKSNLLNPASSSPPQGLTYGVSSTLASRSLSQLARATAVSSNPGNVEDWNLPNDF